MPEPTGIATGNRHQSRSVRAIAGEQEGIVARGQLLAAGMSDSALARALRSGRLHRVHVGVYATVWPELLTEEGHLVAALLAAVEGAILSRLRAHGYTVRRYGDRQIAERPDDVIADLLDALGG